MRATRFLGPGLIFLVLLTAGCVSPERLANHLVTAPNQQGRFISDKWVDYLTKGVFGKKDPLIYTNVTVGPPGAKLSVMELPPADYHVKVATEVTKGRDGKPMFTLSMVPDTNAAVTPLESKGTIVLLHGYITQKETMLPWAVVLAQAGYRVVMVDIRGHGYSTGTNFTAGKIESRDMIQMLDQLVAQKLSDPQVGVLGYSFGADLALYWAARDPRVKTAVLIAAYDKPEEAIPQFAKEVNLPFSEKKVRAAADIAAQKLDIKWSDWNGTAAARQIKVPLFFIGGEKDKVSPPADLVALKAAAPEGSKSLLIAKANHEVIGYWFQELTKPVEEWFRENLADAK